jgi:ADP-heptose:LPS heptosyltransferase
MSFAEGRLVRGLVDRFFLRGGGEGFSLPDALGDEPRLLAIDTGDLSDLLFHMPLLQAVRERHPRARIDFLLPEAHVSLVAPSGIARQCLVYRPRQLKLWSPSCHALLKSVRREQYDLSLVMSFDPQPALETVSLATGAPLRMGPSHPGAYPAVNFEIRSRGDGTRYRGERLAAAAPFLGLPRFAARRGWPLPDEKVRRARQLVRFNKPRQDEVLVGLDPAAAKSGAALAVTNFHALLRQLDGQVPCRVLPLTVSAGAERMAALVAGLGAAPLSLPCESLFDAVLLAAVCDVVIAGNTDLFHFAAAAGVPTLGLFLEQDGPEWVPAAQPHVRVLRVKDGQRIDLDALLNALAAIRAAG